VLGFATVDHQIGSGTAAVWLTNRSSATTATHGNAVRVDLREDSDGLKKIHALTRDRFVLLTDRSTTEGLPLSTEPLTTDGLNGFVAETVGLQSLIGMPPQTPVPALREPDEDIATKRALETANYLARVWSEWLRTDNERRKRAGKHGEPVSEDLPPDFLAHFAPEPVEVFSA
jgi:hypothetical protein